MDRQQLLDIVAQIQALKATGRLDEYQKAMTALLDKVGGKDALAQMVLEASNQAVQNETTSIDLSQPSMARSAERFGGQQVTPRKGPSEPMKRRIEDFSKEQLTSMGQRILDLRKEGKTKEARDLLFGWAREYEGTSMYSLGRPGFVEFQIMKAMGRKDPLLTDEEKSIGVLDRVKNVPGWMALHLAKLGNNPFLAHGLSPQLAQSEKAEQLFDSVEKAAEGLQSESSRRTPITQAVVEGLTMYPAYGKVPHPGRLASQVGNKIAKGPLGRAVQNTLSRINPRIPAAPPGPPKYTGPGWNPPPPDYGRRAPRPFPTSRKPQPVVPEPKPTWVGVSQDMKTQVPIAGVEGLLDEEINPLVNMLMTHVGGVAGHNASIPISRLPEGRPKELFQEWREKVQRYRMQGIKGTPGLETGDWTIMNMERAAYHSPATGPIPREEVIQPNQKRVMEEGRKLAGLPPQDPNGNVTLSMRDLDDNMEVLQKEKDQLLGMANPEIEERHWEMLNDDVERYASKETGEITGRSAGKIRGWLSYFNTRFTRKRTPREMNDALREKGVYRDPNDKRYHADLYAEEQARIDYPDYYELKDRMAAGDPEAHFIWQHGGRQKIEFPPNHEDFRERMIDKIKKGDWNFGEDGLLRRDGTLNLSHEELGPQSLNVGDPPFMERGWNSYTEGMKEQKAEQWVDRYIQAKYPKWRQLRKRAERGDMDAQAMLDHGAPLKPDSPDAAYLKGKRDEFYKENKQREQLLLRGDPDQGIQPEVHERVFNAGDTEEDRLAKKAWLKSHRGHIAQWIHRQRGDRLAQVEARDYLNMIDAIMEDGLPAPLRNKMTELRTHQFWTARMMEKGAMGSRGSEEYLSGILDPRFMSDLLYQPSKYGFKYDSKMAERMDMIAPGARDTFEGAAIVKDHLEKTANLATNQRWGNWIDPTKSKQTPVDTGTTDPMNTRKQEYNPLSRGAYVNRMTRKHFKGYPIGEGSPIARGLRASDFPEEVGAPFGGHVARGLSQVPQRLEHNPDLTVAQVLSDQGFSAPEIEFSQEVQGILGDYKNRLFNFNPFAGILESGEPDTR